MSSSESVTTWIGQLQAGEETALGKLHARYWPRLVELARQRLHGAPRRFADEEDVAQEALWSFCRRVKDGREFHLASRHDLLALLTHIIACKAVNQIQHELGVQKRGAGKVKGERALEILLSGGDDHGLTFADQGQPTPLELAIQHDCYQHFVNRLPDRLRDFGELYLAGLSHKEIADRLGCAKRTVERKVALVLRKWQELAEAAVLQNLPESAEDFKT